jgi:L-lactate dehydrogenase complex protein LldG
VVEGEVVTERDNILARVREALRLPARAPGTPSGTKPAAAERPAAGDLRRVLPSTGETWEERVALFQRHAAELKADFQVVADRAAADAWLGKLRDAEGWKRVGAHRGGWAEAAARSLGLPVCWTDAGYDVRELERCEVGVTECDALIAQTGSVLVTSASAGGRALSVLPPHHVVLARRDQLLPGLPEAFALIRQKHGAAYPSLISFLTGPSRTGDIERILVLGAHGPKRLTIICA